MFQCLYPSAKWLVCVSDEICMTTYCYVYNQCLIRSSFRVILGIHKMHWAGQIISPRSYGIILEVIKLHLGRAKTSFHISLTGASSYAFPPMLIFVPTYAYIWITVLNKPLINNIIIIIITNNPTRGTFNKHVSCKWFSQSVNMAVTVWVCLYVRCTDFGIGLYSNCGMSYYFDYILHTLPFQYVFVTKLIPNTEFD